MTLQKYIQWLLIFLRVRVLKITYKALHYLASHVCIDSTIFLLPSDFSVVTPVSGVF